MVPKNSRHIRWNWQPSPDDSKIARYYFVIVDEVKGRRNKLNKILQQFQEVSAGIDKIYDVKGKVKDSSFMYLFYVCDSRLAPDVLNLKNISKLVIQDQELYERKELDVKKYVERIYEGD